ncbi:MAG: 30S ribosomal protein S6 [Bdellovibrionota bacterium]|nr:MAG: 30S ribosomal protein S6 [Bdellovibrionota bacterium]
MRKYESMIVLHPDLTEGDMKEESQKIEQFLRANGASSVKTSLLGKKEIAYEVAKVRYGFFVAYEFETDAHGIVDLLNRQYAITDAVIKFNTFRTGLKSRKVKVSLRRRSSEFEEGDEGIGAEY